MLADGSSSTTPSYSRKVCIQAPRFAVGNEAQVDLVHHEAMQSGTSPQAGLRTKLCALWQRDGVQGSASISKVKGLNTIRWIAPVLFKSYPLLLVDGPEVLLFSSHSLSSAVQSCSLITRQ